SRRGWDSRRGPPGGTSRCGSRRPSTTPVPRWRGRPSRDARALVVGARAAVAAGADVVVAAGGDGTVRVVCAEMAGTGIPIGIVPMGTGNLLARNLGIPLTADEA